MALLGVLGVCLSPADGPRMDLVPSNNALRINRSKHLKTVGFFRARPKIKNVFAVLAGPSRMVGFIKISNYFSTCSQLQY